MTKAHGFVCLLIGHDEQYKRTFNDLGRHIERKECSRCGTDLGKAFTGPIFPGEAEDPEAACEYIRLHSDRDPPTPDSPIWAWDEDEEPHILPGDLDVEELEEDLEEVLDEMEDKE